MSLTKKATYAALPFTERGQPIVLGADPKGKTFLYTNGKNVIIRDVENPAIADIYSEHSVKVNVAKYSPSGYYIASGDNAGKVRVWDTTQKEHPLKAEHQPLGGAIKDLAWSPDNVNPKIVAAGNGNQWFGKVFTYDSGNTVGNLGTVTKSFNACDYRPQRPFSVVVASEDNSLGFYTGPPFKYTKSIQNHTNFVNCVRFAPDGSVFVSGGADGKCFIFDGKTGDTVGELGQPAHKGGIYGVSLRQDKHDKPGSKILVLTASGDKSCKIWDLETRTPLQEFVMGTTKEDMQVSCIWVGNVPLSVSLSGYINYLDPENPHTPSRIIKGHNKPCTAMVLSEDRKFIYSASSTGHIAIWNAETSANETFSGAGHTSQVQSMAVSEGYLVTCGIDDVVRFSPMSTNTYGEPIKLDSQPKALAAEGGLVVVACIKELVMFRDQVKVYVEKISYEPRSISVHPGQQEVAVGDDQSGVHVYTVNDNTLVPSRHLEHTGITSAVRYSPDGAVLAASLDRAIMLYRLPEYEVVVDSTWRFHTARVSALAFSPNSEYIASGDISSDLFLWDVVNRKKIAQLKGAHNRAEVNSLAWQDNQIIVSAGQDCNINLFTFTAK